jgi:hypothetical protein
LASEIVVGGCRLTACQRHLQVILASVVVASDGDCYIAVVCRDEEPVEVHAVNQNLHSRFYFFFSENAPNCKRGYSTTIFHWLAISMPSTGYHRVDADRGRSPALQKMQRQLAREVIARELSCYGAAASPMTGWSQKHIWLYSTVNKKALSIGRNSRNLPTTPLSKAPLFRFHRYGSRCDCACPKQCHHHVDDKR